MHRFAADFDPTQARALHLHLHIGVDAANYLLQNDAGEVVFYTAHAWESRIPATQLHKRLQGLVRQEVFLQYRYASVRVQTSVGQTVLIPDEWFRADQTAFLFTSATGEDLTEQDVCVDSVAALHLQVLYALPQALQNAIGTCFPQSKTEHSHTALLAAALQMARKAEQLSVYAFVRGSSLTLVVAEAEKVWLLNTYSYQTTKDFLYFVLLVYQQLHLNESRTPLFLAGEIMQESDIYRVLRAYIKHINWVSVPLNTTISGDTEVAPHIFNDLLFK